MLDDHGRVGGAREKIDRYAEAFSRAGKLKATTLYATFNILSDAAKAKEEGWQWMENFFEEPRAKLAHHFTIFATPEECVRLLKGYGDAGLTTLIARIASDDVRGQAQMLLIEIRPRL